MRDESLEMFFDDLASETPAPGGGAAVGVSVALGAALVAMVCRLTLGKKGNEAAGDLIEGSLATADRLRLEALLLAEEDAQAFGEVSSAYKLPRSTVAETADRTAAVQLALVGAARVPLRAARAAQEVAALSEALVGRSNPRVVSDLGCAAACARSAVVGAAFNVRVNVGLLDDPAVASDLEGRIGVLLADTVAVCDQVVQRVESMVGAA